MSKPSVKRGRMRIITELYELTKEMEQRRDDADFLILSVEKRQDLMDEYDILRLQNSDELDERAEEELKRMVKEVIHMDAAIAAALEEHRRVSKKELAASNSQQKLMGYMSGAISASGSYMDYKK